VRDKTEGRKVSRVKFLLEEGQTLFVGVGSFLFPGLNRVFVKNEGGKVEIQADSSSDSHFRFSKGNRGPFSADYVIENIGSAEALADILENRFWRQFGWGDLIAFHEDRKFRRKVRRRVLKLSREFETRAAEELNAIPQPSRK